MNKEYIKEFYKKNRKVLNNSYIGIKSEKDLEHYIESTITSNIQWDFNLDINYDKLMDKRIKVEINNGGIMTLEQSEADKIRFGIALESVNQKGETYRRDLIDEDDFVMLMNYYCYIKDHDIKDDFINRDGTIDRNEYESNYTL